jgi:uncharacterized protein DUF1194
LLKPLLSLSPLLLGAASPARTPTAAVDLALVLAIDTSGSVSGDRMTLQIQGYADAIQNPNIVAAVRAGRHGRIAVTFVHWSSRGRQDQVVGWTVIDDEPSARSFSGAIVKADRPIPGYTSISGAIDFSVRLITEGGHRATRRVIDISGDGYNNDGRDAAEARDEAVAAGITINGLPILLEPEMELDRYYNQEVIGGPEAFTVVVGDFATFSNAILRKLLIEIASAPRSSIRQLA